jgi:hypothetical protein
LPKRQFAYSEGKPTCRQESRWQIEPTVAAKRLKTTAKAVENNRAVVFALSPSG